MKSGLCASKNEARRAVEQGGVSVSMDKQEEKVTDTKKDFEEGSFGSDFVLRRGKKKFKRIVLEG